MFHVSILPNTVEGLEDDEAVAAAMIILPIIPTLPEAISTATTYLGAGVVAIRDAAQNLLYLSEDDLLLKY